MRDLRNKTNGDTGNRSRRVLSPAIAVALAASVAACGSSGSKHAAGSTNTTAAVAGSQSSKCTPSGDPVTVAYIGDFSGNAGLVSIGKAAKAGADTVVAMANATGGINCHPLQLKVSDAASSPDTFATVLREAVNAKPVAFTGLGISSEFAPSISTVATARIPWMSTSPIFTGVDQLPFVYSTQPPPADNGVAAAKALAQVFGGSLQGKKVAVTGSAQSATVDEIINGITSGVRAAGGTVPSDLVFRDPALITQWTSQATNTVSANADAVLIIANDPSTAPVLTALKVAGFKGKALSVLAPLDDTFKTAGSANFYGLRDVGMPVDGTPLHDDVVKAGVSTQDALSSGYFGREFAAMYVLVQTLRACTAPCDTTAFMAAVSKLGPVQVPDGAVPAPVDFTKNRSRSMAGTVWNLDPATGQTAPKQIGQPVTS